MKLRVIILLLSLSLLHAEDILQPGSDTPRFLIQSLGKNRIGLRNYTDSSYGNLKPLTLINFWSITCIPCRKEMPILNDFYSNHKEDVNLVYINLDSKTETEKVKNFVAEHKLTGDILLDIYQSTGKKFNVCEGASCKIPALFGMSPTGKILFSQEGYDASKNLTEFLEVALTNATQMPVRQESPAISPPITDSLKFTVVYDALRKSPKNKLGTLHNLPPAEVQKILKEAVDILKVQWNKPKQPPQ